jgi:cold shock CspA family protein
MRIEGNLSKWNDVRGFGFITPHERGGQNIFVHISAFPREGQRPQLGEPLSFEIDHSGKVQAINVSRSTVVNDVDLQKNNMSKSRRNLHLVGLSIIIVIFIFVGL